VKITGSGQSLGATIEGLDLAQRLSDAEHDLILSALGEHGVIRIPGQRLTGRDLAKFSACFGTLEINVAIEFLFAHQVKAEYRYVFRWQEGDVLMWEDIGTIHNAAADYGADEPRLIKRCQVMADRYY
jgi:alpha-ketoglutarate-dependent taurine dioxygenase